MDLGALVGPAVVAAIVSGIVGVAGFLMNRSTLLTMHREKLSTDETLAQRKMVADIELTERKVALDRSLADWRRKTELAEQVLADFYKARDIFMAARSPFSWSGEGATRQAQANETEDETRRFNALYAPVERLSRERDFLSELSARRFRFMAIFGDQSGEPFLVLVRTYNEIGTAAQALINDARHLDWAVQREYQTKIWVRADEGDPIKLRLDEAVAAIEATCRPAIAVGPA